MAYAGCFTQLVLTLLPFMLACSWTVRIGAFLAQLHCLECLQASCGECGQLSDYIDHQQAAGLSGQREMQANMAGCMFV